MPRNSISKIALKAMSLRLSIVVIIFAMIGFWFNYRQIEGRTQRELEMYVKERVERESIYFHIARKNLKLFEGSFRHDYQDKTRKFHEEFRKKFKRNPDGTWSPANKNNPIQMFLKRDVKITPEMEKSIVVLNDLLMEFGYSWSANFTNVWAAGKEDYGLTFWPDRPDALKDLPPEHSFLIHEFMTVGLPANNPDGEPRWTGPYRDVMSDDWMISLNNPIYINGEFALSIGMDILLNDFYSRSVSNVLPGTYNIIFRPDGRLFSHPGYMEQIKNAQGNFYIGNQDDNVLKSILKKVTETKKSVIRDDENDLFLGVGKIKGPGWWFVLVYPKSNLFKAARETAIFLILIGLISLLLEILIMYQVIQKHISMPIKKLIKASQKIAAGDTGARVEVSSDNELGYLAQSFNIMGEKVLERDKLLSLQTQRLEEQVAQRSKELDEQRAKAFQAAKMATLGEISAGIAHEINNPLSTITLSAGSIRKRLENGTMEKEVLIPYLSRIEDTSHRISKIVKGMRAFSREGSKDEVAPVYIQTIIENTLNLCEETLKKNEVKLESVNIPEAIVMCREVEITQTLLNLIQNAIDALAEVKNKRIKISVELSGETASIIVEDNGPGISPKNVEKIMNPFFTTKEVGKGTGLGLFISYGLVKSNNGNLSLNQKNGSTQFIITLKRG